MMINIRETSKYALVVGSDSEESCPGSGIVGIVYSFIIFLQQI